MLIFKQQKDLLQYTDYQQSIGKKIGFVPTMGALHNGHISLIKDAQNHAYISVCSIFVNPTQFNNPADFAKYPITINQDIDLLTLANCDALYLPSVEDIYPEGIENSKTRTYDLNGLDTILEGAFRPGHFQGVANVVHRLLKACNADSVHMGAKDYQQCKVVQRLIEIENLKTKLIICPTLREKSGLAMSSRNARLSENGKAKSACIYQGLNLVASQQDYTTFATCSKQYQTLLAGNGLELEHLILAEQNSLQQLNEFDNTKKMVLLTAAFCEGVRLIDNLEI
jgi:pantoate--beta-alanine ligase